MSPTTSTSLLIYARNSRAFSRVAVAILCVSILGNLCIGMSGVPGPVVPVTILKLLAVLAACSMATSVEDLLFRRFRTRATVARIIVLSMLAPLAVALSILGAATLGIMLRGLGDAGTTLLAIISGGIWLGSAALGSLIVVLLDTTVARLATSFRVRINLTVLAMVGMAASLTYGAAQLGPDVIAFLDQLRETQLGTNFRLGSFWLWETVQALEPDESAELLALTYFTGLVIIALPAVLSAGGKLADAVMEGLEPLQAGFEAVARGHLDFRLPVESMSDFSRFADTFNKMVSSLALGKRMERAFGSYVSQEILDQIRNQHGQATLEPSLRMATVFFVDIRGFTTMSERINPKQLLAVLNRFYENVATVVDAHQGFLVQYIGDAVVVVFNGPIEQPDHAIRAVDCAIDIQSTVDKLNAERAFPEIGELAVGIGVATGPLVAGNLGDSQHLLQYTVLGDTVNQAARMTSHVPPGAVWCNQRNAEIASKRHEVVALKPIKVKGRARRLVPHQVWPRMDHTEVTEINAPVRANGY